MFQLEKLGVKHDHNRERFLLFLIIFGYQGITIGLLVFLRSVLVKLKIDNTLPTGSLLILLAVISRRSVSVFKMSLLAAAKTRLSHINKGIEDQSNYLNNLKTLLVLHNKFGDVMALLSKCLSFNFFMNIVEFGFHNTMTIFSFYNLVTHDSTFENHVVFVTDMFFLLPEGLYMMSIFECSSLIRKEMNRTSILIHDKTTKSDSPEILRFLQLASLQVDHQMPVISCGLFTFDWKLFFLTISGIFSYVIILIQFDMAGYA